MRQDVTPDVPGAGAHSKLMRKPYPRSRSYAQPASGSFCWIVGFASGATRTGASRAATGDGLGTGVATGVGAGVGVGVATGRTAVGDGVSPQAASIRGM